MAVGRNVVGAVVAAALYLIGGGDESNQALVGVLANEGGVRDSATGEEEEALVEGQGSNVVGTDEDIKGGQEAGSPSAEVAAPLVEPVFWQAEKYLKWAEKALNDAFLDRSEDDVPIDKENLKVVAEGVSTLQSLAEEEGVKDLLEGVDQQAADLAVEVQLEEAGLPVAEVAESVLENVEVNGNESGAYSDKEDLGYQAKSLKELLQTVGESLAARLRGLTQHGRLRMADIDEESEADGTNQVKEINKETALSLVREGMEDSFRNMVENVKEWRKEVASGNLYESDFFKRIMEAINKILEKLKIPEEKLREFYRESLADSVGEIQKSLAGGVHNLEALMERVRKVSPLGKDNSASASVN